MAITRKRITAEEFRRMAQAGVFAEGERLELLEGDIIEMTPISPEDARAVRILVSYLGPLTPRHAMLDVQNPLQLPGNTEFYPDVVLLRPQPDHYRALPQAKDVLLVIEVAKSSVRYDSSAKPRNYAAAGIPDYWMIDLGAQRVHAYRHPEAERYLEMKTLEPDDDLSFMGRGLKVGDLF